MNTLGTIKKVDTEETYRQFVINCLGENDHRKYYMITPFGMDANVPDGYKAFTSDSRNKDDKFVTGFLNPLKLNALNKGDQILFSTTSDGKTMKSFVKLLNDGTLNFNGDADFLAGYTKLKEGFDKLKDDLNALVTKFNTHMHPTAGTGAPSPPTVSGTSSTASIDACKKANLKCE
jgi:hypothetical protein